MLSSFTCVLRCHLPFYFFLQIPFILFSSELNLRLQSPVITMPHTTSRTSSSSVSDPSSTDRRLCYNVVEVNDTSETSTFLNAVVGPDEGGRMDFNSTELTARWLLAFSPANREAARHHYYRLALVVGISTWELLHWKVRAMAISTMWSGMEPPVPFEGCK